MEFEGGCYCGVLRYKASGKPLFKALCHCRECRYFSGGMAALLIGMPKAGFSYTKGTPVVSHNIYGESKAHREFCGQCGTHILACSEESSDLVSMKAGTMDDTELYGLPEMALQMVDKQAYHIVPESIAQYEHWPWS